MQCQGWEQIPSGFEDRKGQEPGDESPSQCAAKFPRVPQRCWMWSHKLVCPLCLLWSLQLDSLSCCCCPALPKRTGCLCWQNLQKTLAFERSLWFSDAARATSGVSESFWVSMEAGKEEGKKNPTSNIWPHFVTRPWETWLLLSL
jgi:hypothetical protein